MLSPWKMFFLRILSYSLGIPTTYIISPGVFGRGIYGKVHNKYCKKWKRSGKIIVHSVLEVVIMLFWTAISKDN